MNKQYYAALTIDGKIVNGSAVANGTKAHCLNVSSRLNKRDEKHPSVLWVVLECVS